MNKELADITLIVDRSGSMHKCRTDAEGGINTFIEEQKKLPGKALFSLFEFDTEVNYVYKGADIKTVKPYTLVPRGATALLDAVGKAIVEAGIRLEKMAEADRPGLVIMAIITDGEENSSREYTKATIKEMIELQKNTYNWQFTFLGANQDAFAEAGALGVPMGNIANYNLQNTSATYSIMSNNVAAARTAFAAGMTVDMSYTDDDRKTMES